MIKIGDRVKFKPEVFEYKRKLAIQGGLFGPPIDLCEHDTFEVLAVNNQGTEDDPDLELRLSNYPWLVYDDEVIKIEEI